MKLPNKLFNYHESIISKFPIVLNELKENKDMSVCQLFVCIGSKFDSITEFIEALECLYLLEKINYNYELRRITYVG